jgi:hypothetical protein
LGNLSEVVGDGMRRIAVSNSRLVITALILLGGVMARASAQDPVLKGLGAVRVLVSWTGGTDAEKDALKTDVELKLRQAGLFIVSDDGSTLFVGIGAGNVAVPVIVELREQGYMVRDLNSRMNFTAFEAYLQWRTARRRDPAPITDAEDKEHQVAVFAEAKENGNLPLSQVLTIPRDVTIWYRYGAAQNAQTESVQQIIARYQKVLLAVLPSGALAADIASPGVRQTIQHMMDLEVQAAMASAQNPVSPGSVHDTIKSYVDAFLNDWLAANRGQH